MADESRTEPAEPETPEISKTCFVVSEFGKTPEDSARTKQVLRHLIKKVLEPMGYDVVRADGIDDEGLITHQIIEHLLDDDLVIADLTNHNPNVFYEVAVRHAARKPIIHIITQGQSIPFDVANMRAVLYALDNPDVLEEAQNELRRKVASIEESGWKAAHNPITAARDVSLLKESDKPELQQAGAILEALADMRAEVRNASWAREAPFESESSRRRVSSLAFLNGEPARVPESIARKRLDMFVEATVPGASPSVLAAASHVYDDSPLSVEMLARVLRSSKATVTKDLRVLHKARIVRFEVARAVASFDPLLAAALRNPDGEALASLLGERGVTGPSGAS